MKKHVVCAVIMLFALTTQAKARVIENPGFSDLNYDDEHYEAIVTLYDKGVISGYPDRTFRPKNLINRAEALKMIYNTICSMKEEDVTKCRQNIVGENLTFTDIDFNSWYINYLRHGVADKIINGYEDGTFKPEQGVNLAELLKMLDNSVYKNFGGGDTYSGGNYFSVSSNLTDKLSGKWYESFFRAAINARFIDESAENVDPAKMLTRADVSEILFRATVARTQLDWKYRKIIPMHESTGGTGVPMNISTEDVGKIYGTWKLVDVKPYLGDVIGVDNLEAVFESNNYDEISGDYIYWTGDNFGGERVCMTNLDMIGEQLLPYWDSLGFTDWLCFNKEQSKFFGKPGTNGKATVTIDKFTLLQFGGEADTPANLVKIIKMEQL